MCRRVTICLQQPAQQNEDVSALCHIITIFLSSPLTDKVLFLMSIIYLFILGSGFQRLSAEWKTIKINNMRIFKHRIL